MNTDKRRLRRYFGGRIASRTVFVFAFCVHLSLISSCASKPTDLRTLVPGDALVYLESNDLAAALQPIVDAKPFREAAKSRPDFSALNGVQVAVAVTGFETSEERVTDENSVARVMPRFVAVADTHAWNFQAVGFAEQKLGGFVTDLYGGELKIEKTDKHGGKYFTWSSSNDSRKAFGLVIGSLIYFGNDESAIEKCLAVRRGETDSISKAGKVQPASADVLASGYVSTDGVAQIAGIAGMQLAAESSDESETQSAIAGIVPQLIRGTVTDASWTMKRSEKGIEDNVTLGVPAETGRVFSETIVAAEPQPDPRQLEYVPDNAFSVTRYNLKDARVAWRSAMLSAQRLADPVTGQIIAEVARIAAADYGVEDPELFLSSLRGEFLTVRMGAEGEESVIIAQSNGLQNLMKSVSKEIVLQPPPAEDGGDGSWQSKDGDMALVHRGGLVFLGSPENVRACFEKHTSAFGKMLKGSAPVVTAGRDIASAAKMIDIIAHENPEARPVSAYVTETRFTRTAVERRTVSDFGLVGSIISFLDE